MLIFILFLLAATFCFFVYVNLTNQLTSQRKRIFVLMNENKELKTKLKTLLKASENQNANIIYSDNLDESEIRDG